MRMCAHTHTHKLTPGSPEQSLVSVSMLESHTVPFQLCDLGYVTSSPESPSLKLRTPPAKNHGDLMTRVPWMSKSLDFIETMSHSSLPPWNRISTPAGKESPTEVTGLYSCLRHARWEGARCALEGPSKQESIAKRLLHSLAGLDGDKG